MGVNRELQEVDCEMYSDPVVCGDGCEEYRDEDDERNWRMRMRMRYMGK